MSAEPRLGIIYKITNNVTGKVYVGQTATLLRFRTASHKYDSKRPLIKSALYGAVRKYGWENFKVETLEASITISDLDAREQFWIEELDCIAPNGYNLSTGGGRPVFTEEARKNMSLAATGKKRGPMSEETKRKIGDGNRGKKQSQKQRAASSERQKKDSYFHHLTSAQQAAYGALSKGVPRGPHTEEWKAKLRASNSGSGNPFFGRTHTEETRAKLRANHKCPRDTKEYRETLSRAVTAWWAKRKAIHGPGPTATI